MIKNLFIQSRTLLIAGGAALAVFAFLFSSHSAQAAGSPPIPTVTSLSVYESSNPAAGSGGTEICAGVSLTSASECAGTLEHGATYRFEVTISEGGGAAFDVTSHDFENAVGAGDVLGTVNATTQFSGAQCAGKTAPTRAIVSSVTARASGYSGATKCSVAKNGTGIATWLITIDTDAVDGQATATFLASDGSVSDQSTATTFNVAPPTAPNITVAGTAYEDEASTAMAGCSSTVSISVNGATKVSGTCAAGTGVIAAIDTGLSSIAAGTPIVIWLDDATDCGGNNANSCATTVIIYSGSGNITDAVLRRNRLIVRDDDGSGIDNIDLKSYCNSDAACTLTDTDIVYEVDSSNNLTVEDNIKLMVNTSDVFTPGGTVTTSPSASAATVDGDVLIQASGQLAMGANALSVGGDFTATGTFTKSSGQTTTFTATATGHAINMNGNFENVVFNGSGGVWTLVSTTSTFDGNLTMTAGELQKSSSGGLVVAGGNVTGNGTISFTGTAGFTVNNAGQFGGSTAWIFYNLAFGGSGTTTADVGGASGGIIVTNFLSVNDAHGLDAGGKTWTLSNSGTPFTRSGGFDSGTSTVAYLSGSGVSALASASMSGADSDYYNLTINGGGNFTAGVAVDVLNELTITSAINALLMGSNNLRVGSTSVTNSGSIKVHSIGCLNQSPGGTTTILGSASGSNCIGSDGGSCSGTAGVLVFGNLTIGDGATTFTTTLVGAPPTTTIDSTFTITANAAFDAGTGSTIRLTSSGTPISRSGTFTRGTSLVTYQSGSGVSALSSAAMTGANAFYDLAINGTGSFTAGAAIEAARQLDVTSGSFLMGSNNLTVGSTGVTDSGQLQVASGQVLNQGAGGTTTIKSSAASTAACIGSSGASCTGTAGTIVFGSLDIGDAATTFTTTIGGTTSTTIDTTFTITASATLDAGSATTTVAGTGAPFAVSGNYTPNSSVFVYRGAGATDITATTYNKLKLQPTSGSPVYTLGIGTTAANSDWEIGNNSAVVTVTTTTNNPTVNVTGDLDVKTNAILSGTGSNIITISGGDAIGAGTINLTGGGFAVNGAGTVGAGTAWTFNNLTVGGADATTTAASDITVGTALTVNDTHGLDLGSGVWLLSGSGTPFVRNGGVAAGSGTFIYQGTGATNIAATTYNNLTLQPPSGSPTYTLLGGTLSSSNNLVVGDGTNAVIVAADTNSPTISVSGDVTINDQATFTASGSAGLTASGNWTVNGAGVFNSSNGTVTFNGSSTKTINGDLNEKAAFHHVTFSGSGTYNWATTTTLTGDLTVSSGTINGNESIFILGNVAGAGVISHTGNSFNVYNSTNFGGSGNWSFANLVFGDGTSDTTTAAGGGTITATSTLTIAANQILNAGSKTWQLGLAGTGFTGTPLVIDGALTASSSTFKYEYDHLLCSADCYVTPATYNNLTLNSAGSVGSAVLGTAGGQTIIVNSNLVCGDNGHIATYTAASNNPTIDVAGNFTLTNCVLTAPGSSPFTVGGSWSNSGTFTHNSGTVTFDDTSGDGAETLSGTLSGASGQFNNLVFNGSGGAWSNSAALATVGDLTVTLGTLSGTNNITVSGGDATGNGTISRTGGTFTLNGAGQLGGSTAWTFSNLTFGGTGTTTADIDGASGGIIVNSILTINDAHGLDAGGKTWTIAGALTSFTRSGGFDSGTSTVVYTSGSGVIALASASMSGADSDFYNLTINGSGNFTAGVAVDVLNELTITNGTLLMGSNNLRVGSTSVANSGSIKVAYGKTLNQSSGGTTTVLSSASGSNCIGSNFASCGGTPGTIVFGSLTIGDSSTAFTTTLGGTTPTTTIDSTFTITANATLDAGTGSTITLTANGTPFVKTGTFTANTGKMNFASAGTGGTAIPAATYYDLTVNKTSNTFTADSGTLNVDRDLDITAGTLDFNASDPTAAVTRHITITGTLSASSDNPLTFKSNFTNNGTFTHNNGTVVATPSSTDAAIIGGISATTFNNFTANQPGYTLHFRASLTIGFDGALTLTGAVNNRINIDSTTGTQWWVDMNPGSSSAVTYAAIQDSGCAGGTQNIDLNDTNKSRGNNGGCWKFPVPAGGLAGSNGGSGGGTPQSGGVTGGSGGGTEGGSGGGTPQSDGDDDGGGATP